MKRPRVLTSLEIRRRRKLVTPMAGHDGCFYLNRHLKVRFKTQANGNERVSKRRSIVHIIGIDKNGCHPDAVFLRESNGWWSVGCFEII